jgi:FKBP-type peptidyl-prolyl cis-trans isomerase
MKMKWIALLGLGLMVAQANAETPVVIDNQMIGKQPTDSKDAGATSSQAPTKAQTDDEAARERILRGGKVSTRERAQLVKAEVGEANKTEGENFLASNGAKSGVVTLPSGVQYRILRAGKGKMATEENSIMCRYKGAMVNGQSFDMTEGKKPALMQVAGFLPGVKEAVKLMPIGSKWEIVVPPQLAYGATGNRGVGPNAVVVYQMEILSIK